MPLSAEGVYIVLSVFCAIFILLSIISVVKAIQWVTHTPAIRCQQILIHVFQVIVVNIWNFWSGGREKRRGGRPPSPKTRNIGRRPEIIWKVQQQTKKVLRVCSKNSWATPGFEAGCFVLEQQGEDSPTTSSDAPQKIDLSPRAEKPKRSSAETKLVHVMEKSPYAQKLPRIAPRPLAQLQEHENDKN